MKMKKKSTHNRGVASFIASLAPVVMMLFMTGLPAFGQYSLSPPASSLPITINNDTDNDGEAVNGFPSFVTVPGVSPAGSTENLEKVTVTINGFSHGYPNDVVLLLVGPSGTPGVSNLSF
jgi:hypothetical protein